MSASFAYEDPFLRQQTQAGMNTTQKASAIFKDMGKGMWTTGKGFGKVGMLFAGVECVIESVRSCYCFLLVHCCDKFFSTRAKNDIYNSLSTGMLVGGFLARNSGPKAAFGGGVAFAAFSAAIDIFFLRRETPESAWLLSFHRASLICFYIARIEVTFDRLIYFIAHYLLNNCIKYHYCYRR